MKKLLLVLFFIFIGNLMVFSNGKAETVDNYPSKTIELIVPANPGGDTDGTARFVAKYVSQELGVNIPIINMAGAAGAIAFDKVKKSSPDGYTALYFHIDAILNGLLGRSEEKWNDLFKISAITTIATDYAIITRNDMPYKNLTELKSYLNKTKEKPNFAMETGGIAHVLSNVIQQKMGVEFTPIDIGGAPAKIAALKGKHVDMISIPLILAKDYIEIGEFVCLGILGEERNPLVPEMPTCKEQGVDVSYEIFNFIAFPKETPDEIVNAFSEAIKTISTNKDYINDMAKYHNLVNYLSPIEATKYMQNVEDGLKTYVNELLNSAKH